MCYRSEEVRLVGLRRLIAARGGEPGADYQVIPKTVFALVELSKRASLRA